MRQATDNIHKLVNDEEASSFLKTHLKHTNGDAKMLNEEEEKREHKIQSLVSRVQELPKSLQLSL